ncbi:hypothetical protein NHL51_01275 [Leucobacter sp. gxy201]|uniref:hypothetical protein n=1 Tax=Leucobacter sp. gxy201 TaxID=2957200 RepID=UPI003DA10F42
MNTHLFSLSTDDLRTALAQMSNEDRTQWVEYLRIAAANLGNAAYGLAGNVPEAEPDPTTWSLTYLSLGLNQLQTLLQHMPPEQEQ